MGPTKLRATLLVAAVMLSTTHAHAFAYIVQQGETLASIAERIYGRIQYEKILVAANALEAQGGTPIVPGMRLEIPAVEHRRLRKGESWVELATELLGAPHRSEALALANGEKPWIPPEEGAEILIPYNLRVIVKEGDHIVSLAYKFLGEQKKAWLLDQYNGLKGRRLQRGDAVLIPLTDLPLTEEGKRAAARAATARLSQAAGDARQTQARVAQELPALLADIRGGRYVDAISRATRFLAMGDLKTPQLATIHRQLLEAYAALNATGLATAACNDWRRYDPDAELDPRMLSPKVISACNRGAP